MSLVEQLIGMKAGILREWFDLVAATYPPDTAGFLKRQTDPFDNPVGNATRNGLNGVFDELVGDMNREAIVSHLDPIIRIRAIQNFTPSQATRFVFQFKDILRKELKRQLKDPHNDSEMQRLEKRIDELGLIAFDIYVECKEKIFELRANMEKTKVYKAFHRAGLVTDLEDEKSDLRGH